MQDLLDIPRRGRSVLCGRQERTRNRPLSVREKFYVNSGEDRIRKKLNMATDHSSETGGLRFVDPTVDPSLLWDGAKSLAEFGLGHLFGELIKRYLWRYPTAEYAVGFDGVDDWIRVRDLSIHEEGLELKTRMWVENQSEGNEFLHLVNAAGDTIFRLINKQDDAGLSMVYRTSGSLQSTDIYGIETKTWQGLRVWSDGCLVGVEVDESPIGHAPEVDFQEGPFTLYFGGGHGDRYFRGMVKHLNISSGGSPQFKLQSGDNIDVTGDAGSDAVGLHILKKERFGSEFK